MKGEKVSFPEREKKKERTRRFDSPMSNQHRRFLSLDTPLNPLVRDDELVGVRSKVVLDRLG